MTDDRTPGATRVSPRRAALTVATGLLPAGALAGALWAWLAPPVKGVVVLTHSGERLHDYLGSESDHFFVAAFLMLGLLNVVAAVAAVLAWQWRAHRGPEMVVALCTGMVIAAAAAVGVGVLLAHLRYGTVRSRDSATESRPSAALLHAGGAGFLRPIAAAGRLHAAAARGYRCTGVRGAGGGHLARRPRRLPARRGGIAAGRKCYGDTRHNGRRRTDLPVMTLAAIMASLAIPT